MDESDSVLSVVVPTRDRPEKLARCLASLREALRPGDELIVVDSASRQPARGEQVAGEIDAIFIRCERPGVCRARNAGWRQARHGFVAFVDDDVWVHDGWANAIAGAFVKHPDVAFLTGRIDVPPAQADTERPVALKDDTEPAVLDAHTGGVLGHSANMAARRDALEKVGGFDESLGAGGRFRAAPELDLFDRLFAAGLTGRYEPDARAWHDQWRGRRELVKLDYAYGVGTGARLAKLVRSDKRRARAVAVDALWRRGARQFSIDLLRGYETGAIFALSGTAGTAVGFARAIFVPVRDGHFVTHRHDEAPKRHAWKQP